MKEEFEYPVVEIIELDGDVITLSDVCGHGQNETGESCLVYG